MAVVFDHYRPRLERMVSVRLDVRHQGHYDADDLMQDVFLIASKRLAEYLTERKLPFYLWLRLIAFQKVAEMNRAHNAQKRGAGRVGNLPQSPATSNPSGASGEMGIADTGTSPSGVAMKNETKVKLKQALQQLDPLDQEILLLRHFELLSNTEAAQVLEISENTASQRHFRALKRLKQLFEDDQELKDLFS